MEDKNQISISDTNLNSIQVGLLIGVIFIALKPL